MSLNQLVDEIQKQQLKMDIPTIRLGDTIKLGILVQERNKQRIQAYKGVLIAQHKAGRGSTLTVRRVFQGVGTERIFLLHSPLVQYIEVIRSGKVSRSKLYYLRSRKGKSRRLRERIVREA